MRVWWHDVGFVFKRFKRQVASMQISLLLVAFVRKRRHHIRSSVTNNVPENWWSESVAKARRASSVR